MLRCCVPFVTTLCLRRPSPHPDFAVSIGRTERPAAQARLPGNRINCQRARLRQSSTGRAGPFQVIPWHLLLFGPAELEYGGADDSVQTLNLAARFLNGSSRFSDSVNLNLESTGFWAERFISNLESTRSALEALCLKSESTGFRNGIQWIRGPNHWLRLSNPLNSNLELNDSGLDPLDSKLKPTGFGSRNQWISPRIQWILEPKWNSQARIEHFGSLSQ